MRKKGRNRKRENIGQGDNGKFGEVSRSIHMVISLGFFLFQDIEYV
jgi:hypothetical protein